MFLLFLSAVGHAAESAEHGAHSAGIPYHTVFWQVFNLSILLGALIYFVRQPLKDYFRQRQAKFHEEARKSARAREEAEKQFLDIKHKLEHMKNTHEDNLARAEAEAADMHRAMLKEAQEISARIRQEAQMTARVETSKARLELHEKFAHDVIASARSVLTKDVGQQDHTKLQSDFVRNIEAVAP